MEKRTFAEIAKDIRNNWNKVNYAAEPYLEAMECLHHSDPFKLYGYETAESIVLYFLANASTFRGQEARRIKAELKAMLK